MTLRNTSPQPVLSVDDYVTIRQLTTSNPAFTEGGIRALIFRAKGGSMSIEAVKSRIDWAKPYVAPRTEQARPPLRSLNVKELLELEIPPREMILNPILPAQGLVMLYAPRGIGKTHVALWMAYTIACGGEMFGKKGVVRNLIRSCS